MNKEKKDLQKRIEKGKLTEGNEQHFELLQKRYEDFQEQNLGDYEKVYPPIEGDDHPMASVYEDIKKHADKIWIEQTGVK